MPRAVVLQARISSTRLPRKALLPLSGRSLGFRVMEALRLVRADAYVLATDAESAPLFADDASEAGFALVVGPRDDVLARYCIAIRSVGAYSIIRATGDNPLVSFELANALQDLYRDGDIPDYASFDAAPVGSGVELVRSSALLEAETEAVDPYEREHVCPFLYRRPGRFRIDRPAAPPPYDRPELRVTVDTLSDYERVKGIFDAVHRGSPIALAATIYCLDREGRA
jgi:spore coat polysaccharide biosynthesis protein SpsF